MTRNVRKATNDVLVQTDLKEILKNHDRDHSGRARASLNLAMAQPFVQLTPFDAPISGFSWLPSFVGRPYLEEMQLQIDKARGDMQAVLFGDIEFRNVRRVLDIGCRHATDLIELAQNHGHLVLDGCNISEDQIDFGRRAIAKAGLEGRVHLHHLDSAQSDFPGVYDLVISRQVIQHVQDKDGVLRNISEHLRKGAFLVAAEIVSNREEPIDHEPSSAHFATRQNWANLLARYQLRLARCVDVSREVANCLHDDDLERTLHELVGDTDMSAIGQLHGLHSLGQLLHKGLASYLLLLVQRDYLSTTASLLAENGVRLERPTPYVEARRSPTPQSLNVVLPTHSLTEPITASAPPAFVSKISSIPTPKANSVNAPRDSICKMVGDLLGCAPEFIDAEHTLVAQGLNSILAMKLSMRLKETFGLSVSVKGLLNGATVSSLVRSVPDAVAGDVPIRTAQPVVPPDVAPPSESWYADALRNLGAMSEVEINRLLAQLETRRELS